MIAMSDREQVANIARHYGKLWQKCLILGTGKPLELLTVRVIIPRRTEKLVTQYQRLGDLPSGLGSFTFSTTRETEYMTEPNTERTKYLHRPNGRILFRVGGKTIERLPDDEASAEFAAAYDRLIGELRGGKFGHRKAVGRPAGGTADLKQLSPGSYVYFVECGDLVKIGVSSRPVSRLCHMQSNSSLPLTVRGTVRGGRDVERFIHKLFRKYRKHGEWFSIEGTLAEFLREHFGHEHLRREAN